jgi:phospholipase/carboxylesterase
VILAAGQRVPDPHHQATILTGGTPIAKARAAMVMCHGRGAAADDMLALAAEFEAPQVAIIAPQAAHGTWYPKSFLAPLRENEPPLSSALALLGAIVEELEREGIPPSRLVLFGFSQGGCLALEFAGRNARRYGGVVGLSAGLIGPPGRSWQFAPGLNDTPVFLGCSDRDPHIPRDRVEESAREFERIGGRVELQIYRDLGHTVNQDEVNRVQRMLLPLVGEAA